MISTQFKVTLKLQAPILTHTSGAVSFGLDAAMQKDTKGRPVFTGSLIRGNLRHIWEELQEITGKPEQKQIQIWLGKEADTANQQPERAKLSFSEYWVDNNWVVNKGKRYRIAIDENTGAVKTGALQVIDSPYAVGETPEFTGVITARLKNQEEVDDIKKWLEHAFSLIPAIGALKTNGFGKLLKANIEINEIPSDETKLDDALLKQTEIGLRIQPQSAFCFAKGSIGEDNHFETETFIPAAALVAAIANHIEDQKDDYAELEKHLSKLHFTHAQDVPSGKKKRPVALPLSMVEASSSFYNIADEKEAKLINGEAPTFLIDWKGKFFNLANKKLNYADSKRPEIQLKIRTAIERSTGAAKDSQLFSMETVSPEGFEWISELSVKRVPEDDREKVIQQLHKLFKLPLAQLGKTKTSAIIRLEPKHSYTTPEQSINSDQVIIYLQSPARLLPTAYQNNGTNQGDDLFKAYKESWEQLSDNNLALSHFFAQQKLQGGEHWWQRNRKRQGRYHPEILTQTGSVFILNLVNDVEKAKQLLQTWQQLGLPQLSDATEAWDDNPWIAANGYGEIAINLDIAGGAKHD